MPALKKKLEERKKREKKFTEYKSDRLCTEEVV